jgi:hypothetical protein
VDGLDFLLITWWFFAVATILPASLFARRLRIHDRNAAVSAYLRGQTNSHPRITALTAALPRPAYFAFLILILILSFGLVGFLWANNWTRMLYFNSQLLGICFGTVCAWIALSPKAHVTKQGRLPAAAIRTFMFIFGVLATPVFLFVAAGDLVLPHLIVEGRVDSKQYYSGYRSGDSYTIVIDGRSYNATREAYLPINKGERIHAELGAASKMLFVWKRI